MNTIAARVYYLTKHMPEPELEAERAVCKLGVPYRLQATLPSYTDSQGKKKQPIADFLFPEHKVVLEVDGKEHRTEKGLAADQERDAFLSSKGYVVVRATNEDILDGEEDWLQTLQNALGAAEPHPLLPVPRGNRKRRRRKAIASK